MTIRVTKEMGKVHGEPLVVRATVNELSSEVVWDDIGIQRVHDLVVGEEMVSWRAQPDGVRSEWNRISEEETE